MGRNSAQHRGGKKGGVKTKPRPKKPAAAAPAPSPAPGGSGMSPAFQFAELQLANSDVADGQMIWTPHALTKPTKVKEKWIYAFRFGEVDVAHKPVLAMEYQADKTGALAFVDGTKRRQVEIKSAAKPVSVAAAQLPLMENGKRARYAFVVVRGRLSLSAIRSIENGLHPIYERHYLGQDLTYKKGDSGDFFVSALDPLTLAEKLKDQHHRALVEAVNAVSEKDDNPQRAEAAKETRKYELAKMIRDNLLEPKDGPADPLDIKDYLINQGGTLKNDIAARESKLRTLNWGRRNAARELVRFFKSKIWFDAYDWYLGTKQTAEEIGHVWLDSFFRNIDRLGETQEGRAFLAELLSQRERNVLSYLFVPEKESNTWELWVQRYPIMRKSVTAAVVGLAELGPALAVHGKLHEANRVYLRTIEKFFKSSKVVELTVGPSGHVQRLMSFTVETTVIRITEWKGAKADLEGWIEEGKAKWPEDHKFTKASELATRLFMGIEAINFVTKLREMIELFNKQPAADHVRKDCFAAEAVAAALDLIVAFEEPILHYAHTLAGGGGHAAHGAAHAGHAASEASHAQGAAAVAAGKKEARAIFGEVIPAPVMFKALGAASAAIDTVVYFIEAREAAGKGDHGVAVGDYLISGGSAFMCVGSVLSAASYIATSAALASDGALAASAFIGAAAASLLVVGVVIAAVGFLVVTVCTTSAWQKFAKFCHWGTELPKKGWDHWSGGDFAKWTDSKEGYEKQLQVLTAMLCSYTVSGGSYNTFGILDAHTITVHFGAIPPNAQLDVEFWIRYASHKSKRLGYVIDIDSGKLTSNHDAPGAPRIRWHWGEKERLTGITVEAERLINERVADAWCKVVVRYSRGAKAAPVATGTIPIKDPCVYKILENSGSVHGDLLNSLDVGEEEEEKEGAEHGGGGEHGEGRSKEEGAASQ